MCSSRTRLVLIALLTSVACGKSKDPAPDDAAQGGTNSGGSRVNTSPSGGVLATGGGGSAVAATWESCRKAGCSAPASENCANACLLDCQPACAMDVAGFDCASQCREDCLTACPGLCQVECGSDSSCLSPCQTACARTCEGECKSSCGSRSPEAACDERCQGKCEGQCTASANAGCQSKCQRPSIGTAGGGGMDSGGVAGMAGDAGSGSGGVPATTGGSQPELGGNGGARGGQTGRGGASGGRVGPGGQLGTGGLPAGQAGVAGALEGQGGSTPTGGVAPCDPQAVAGGTGGRSGDCGTIVVPVPVVAGGAGGAGGEGGVIEAGGAATMTIPACVELAPPSYINVSVCSCYRDNGTSGRTRECVICCGNAGYSDSSFIHNNACTCGRVPRVSDNTVCAASIESLETCSACCIGSGFSRSGWTATSCSCSGARDPEVCALTLLMPNPSQACPNCCINHGYLGIDFSAAIGGARCICSS